ncbi:MFS transporter, DHA1 family, inner membrane transport protein [Kushneria avicenniae]|uniref:MFS transporter, DHA1 family, inner membrane transport protein n=1 Tax=Kushneria avicenniae TaxID=402385 RepID=A0A1I1G5P2_9GAMM|nr:MFS transporter [Kushneria avicenniae]SFC06895.1 MFS transporter, DHA1 family, inner membrane transport protein [Kushneria avicenniae]
MTRHITPSFLALLALAFGSFVISTSEFASMGLLPLFADGLNLDVPMATNAITAYALGVMAGAPLITIGAASVNKRTLLIILLVVAVLANLLTAVANDLGLLVVARFLSGLPQGAYFGAASVVATAIVGMDRGGRAISLVMGGITFATIVGAPVGTLFGQMLGWRIAYLVIAGLGALATLAIIVWLKPSAAYAGSSLRQELSALGRLSVWGMLVFAAIVVASLFSVYTFVGPLVSHAGLPESITPIALALIGIGMALGNMLGGYLADRYRFAAMIAGFLVTLVMLAIMALTTSHPASLLIMLAVTGFTLMVAVPTIPLQMMKLAPEAPTLMGSLNMASFNIANALGAAAGGVAVHAGFGVPSAIWAGSGLTALGLVFFLVIRPYLKTPADKRAASEKAHA